MARLASFIAKAQTTLEFALYDLCLSGPLMQWLKLALQERAAARVQVRICYDGDKPYVPNLAGGQDPASAGTGAICALVRLPFRPDRRDETDAPQVHHSRSSRSLDRVAQSDE